jgi:hypothetical protein
VFALVFGFAGSSRAVQVTFFGSGLPTPDPSNFEDCGPATFDGKSVIGSVTFGKVGRRVDDQAGQRQMLRISAARQQ